MPNPAAVAYEAYRKSFSHTNMPTWEKLSSIDKNAWWAVIRALAEISENY